MIPYGRQTVDQADRDAVDSVLRSDWLTQGPAVEAFEDALAEQVQVRFVVAFANGTAALHGATAAAGLGPGDLVVTSPLSFVASANCARYVGAAVDFVDIEPGTMNLDLTSVPNTVDAVVAVHYAGLPADLSRLSQRPRVVIEDAAHALGAMTPDGPVGSCARSDLCVFSFHPVKTVTTAEGGAVTTNDPELAERLRTFRTHGVVRPPGADAWRYDVATLGFNYRLSDVHAALGSSQLVKLDRFVERRQELAARYRRLLAHLPIELQDEAPAGTTNAQHLFPVRVADRKRVFDGMRAAGIGVQVHYVPIYQHSLYESVDGDRRTAFPETERSYDGLLSLPIFPALTDEEQDRVVATFEALLSR